MASPILVPLSGISTRLVSQPDEFAALQPAWERLHRRCAPDDVFLSHEWLDAAWQWCQQHGRLHVVCFERQGELVGALPLLLSARAGRRFRTLEFVAVPDTQRCDVLAAAADRASVLALLAQELQRRQADWDVVRLRGLAADSLALTRLRAALGEARLRCEVAQTEANPWIPLHGDWKAFYAARSRRLKKALNLAANRLARAGAVEIAWLAPGTGERSDVERAVDRVIQISARSWKQRTGNSLDQAGPQAFFRRLAEHAHRRGWLSIWTLSLDGRPVAMELQLVCAGNVYALRSDFDAALEDVSPGSHLNRHMLEGLFGRGLARYFMGPGANPYKYRWADDTDAVHTMAIYGRSLRSRSLAAWDCALKPAARRVRDRLQRRTATPPDGSAAAALDQ